MADRAIGDLSITYHSTGSCKMIFLGFETSEGDFHCSCLNSPSCVSSPSEGSRGKQVSAVGV